MASRLSANKLGIILGFFKALPCAADLLEDFLSIGAPDVPPWCLVPLGEVHEDGLCEFAGAGEAAFPDHVLTDVPEEPFHEIEPRGGGRGEVQVEPRMALQPGRDSCVLVGAVVVEDQMQVYPLGGFAGDLPEEAKPFPVGMTGRSAVDDLALVSVTRPARDPDPAPRRCPCTREAPTGWLVVCPRIN